MAGADQRDTSGLPADGEGVESGERVADAAVTQSLPVIRRYPAPDTPTIRAVARRAAAALPAIGRTTEPRVAPRSARMSAGPQTTEAGPAAADSAGLDPAGSDPAGLDPGVADSAGLDSARLDSARSDPAVADSAAAVPAASEAADPAEPLIIAQPEPSTVLQADPAADVAAVTHEPESPVAIRTDAPIERDEPVEPETVVAPGRSAPTDVIEAEIVEPLDGFGPVAARRPGGHGGAASRSLLPDTHTDEWIQPTDDDDALLPVPAGHRDPAVAEADEPPRRDLVRAGPAVLEADSWDIQPDGDPMNEAYHGRRRAGSSDRRRWLVAVLILLLVGGGIGAALLLTSGAGSEAAGPGVTATGGDSPTLTDPTSELGPPSSSPGGSIRPPAPATTTRGGVVPPTTTASPTTSPTASPTPPPFEPLTYEAEAGSRGGGAVVSSAADASGGQVVDRLGDWGPGPNGSVQFAVGPIPSAGTYTVTVYYLFLADSGDSNRRLKLVVNGVSTSTRQVGRVTACCGSTSFTVTLGAGTNTISVTHDYRQAPAIDRIVISKA